MVNPETGLGLLLSFPKPRQAPKNQTDHLIFRILESKDSLMTALEHLRDSYNAVMVGKPLGNADEILIQAESALKQAEDVMGHVPVTPTTIQDLHPQRQLLLFPAV